MKIKIEKHIQEYLEEFDLNEREVAIYLTLLKTGPNTIMNLSRETGIKRSTTHNNVEELIKKGLVSQTNYGERRMVVAEDPEKLKFLLDQKKWKMKKLEEGLPSVVENITRMIPEDRETSDVEVKYYEGVDNIYNVYQEAFSAKELRSLVNLEASSKAFPSNKDLYLEIHGKNKNSKVWEIVESSPSTVELAKTFGKSDDFKFKTTDKIESLESVDTLIYDGKIALVNIKQITCTVIKNEDYYNVMKAVFGIMWDSL